MHVASPLKKVIKIAHREYPVVLDTPCEKWNCYLDLDSEPIHVVVWSGQLLMVATLSWG